MIYIRNIVHMVCSKVTNQYKWYATSKRLRILPLIWGCEYFMASVTHFVKMQTHPVLQIYFLKYYLMVFTWWTGCFIVVSNDFWSAADTFHLFYINFKWAEPRFCNSVTHFLKDFFDIFIKFQQVLSTWNVDLV